MLFHSKYKVLSKLNKNIWKNNEKLLSFKKKKWSRLQSNIKRTSFLNSQIPWRQIQNQTLDKNYLQESRTPLFSEQGQYYLKKSNIRFFKNNFIKGIEYRLTHGNITQRQLQVILNKVKLKKNSLLFNNLKENMLLQKLDYSLWTLNLISSLFEIKQLISHKHVYVNGKVLNMNMYNLLRSDVVSLKYSGLSLTNANSYLNNVHNYIYYKHLLNLPEIPNLNSFNNIYWINLAKLKYKEVNENKFSLFQDPRKL